MMAGMMSAGPWLGAIDSRRHGLYLYAALFAGAVLSFCLVRTLGDRIGLAAEPLAIAGSATCGWSWLVSRALFRAPDIRRQFWPLVLVLGLIAVETFLRFGDRASLLARIIGNVETLVSSTLLLLAMAEPLTGYRGEIVRSERQFRVAFAAGYGLLLIIAVIGIDGAKPGSAAATWGGPIKTACAALALAGTALAVRYRGANPLPSGRPHQRRVTIANGDLGERLAAVICDAAVYTLPDLRVADVARRLGEAEYKVTQCITGTLGFRNFNHLVNHARVAAARRMFADAAFDRLPVLTIALDCGFGSIGPFNRAFKAETGMTPLHFRRSCRVLDQTHRADA